MYNAEFAYDKSVLWRRRNVSRGLLKLCNFRKVEFADLHSGDHHFEGFFAGGSYGWAEEFDVAEQLQDGLIEAEIADSGSDFAVFNEEKAIAGHARHYLFVRVDFADVPEAGDEEAAVGGSDHFFEGGIAAGENEVHGGFTVFIGKSETVAGGLFVDGFGAAAGVDEIFGDAAIDELDFFAGDAFAVEGGAELEGVVSVVGDGDILAEERLVHAVVEAGALVLEGCRGEVVEEEADEIKDGGGLEDYRVAAWGEF